MSCKGVCTRYKASKPTGIGRYEIGQKRCQICEIFLDIGDKLWCPCCLYRVRGKPRNIKYKSILQEVKIKAGMKVDLYRKNSSKKRKIMRSGKGTLVKLLSEPHSNEKLQMWKVKLPRTRNTPTNFPEFVVRFIKPQP